MPGTQFSQFSVILSFFFFFPFSELGTSCPGRSGPPQKRRQYSSLGSPEPKTDDSTALLSLYVAETIGFLNFFAAKCRQYSTFETLPRQNHWFSLAFRREVQTVQHF